MGESPLGNRAGRLHLACVKMFFFRGGGKNQDGLKRKTLGWRRFCVELCGVQYRPDFASHFL